LETEAIDKDFKTATVERNISDSEINMPFEGENLTSSQIFQDASELKDDIIKAEISKNNENGSRETGFYSTTSVFSGISTISSNKLWFSFLTRSNMQDKNLQYLRDKVATV
jgi:hypothetical protein